MTPKNWNGLYDLLSLSYGAGSLRVYSLQVSFQILFLDRGPANGTFLALQCYPRLGVEPLKNISPMSVRFFVARIPFAIAASLILLSVGVYASYVAANKMDRREG